MQLSKIAVRACRLLDYRGSLQRICGHNSNLTTPLSLMPRYLMRYYSEQKQDVEISGNPFFEKYKNKIRHMQSTNPQEYEEKMKDLAKRLHPQAPDESDKSGGSSEDKSSKPVKIARPSEAARGGVGMTRTKSLDSVMKMELIEDKTAEEITKIWNQYHSGKDCIFTVLKDHEYQNLLDKSKECPVFVFPIRRNDGFEMILAQFDRYDVYFTPLAMFQLVKEDSPPCLTLNHFTELMDEKGIVLMSGQYDEKVLSQQLALSLVQQVSIFYGKHSKFYHFVQKFNHAPEKFDYNELIEAFKTLPQYDMQ